MYKTVFLRCMDINVSSRELKLLETIAAAAQKNGTPAFLIGGFVRDKIMQRPTKDIDVVCLGDGIELAEAVAKSLQPRPQVNFFKNFGTAQFIVDDTDVEFVGARKKVIAVKAVNLWWKLAL